MNDYLEFARELDEAAEEISFSGREGGTYSRADFDEYYPPALRAISERWRGLLMRDGDTNVEARGKIVEWFNRRVAEHKRNIEGS